LHVAAAVSILPQSYYPIRGYAPDEHRGRVGSSSGGVGLRLPRARENPLRNGHHRGLIAVGPPPFRGIRGYPCLISAWLAAGLMRTERPGMAFVADEMELAAFPKQLPIDP
jgi:hypothetical protein